MIMSFNSSLKDSLTPILTKHVYKIIMEPASAQLRWQPDRANANNDISAAGKLTLVVKKTSTGCTKICHGFHRKAKGRNEGES
jgi:hypothetical protein